MAPSIELNRFAGTLRRLPKTADLKLELMTPLAEGSAALTILLCDADSSYDWCGGGFHTVTINNDSNSGNGTQNEEPEQEIRNPGKLDFEKAAKVAKKLIRENKEWLKEMAER